MSVTSYSIGGNLDIGENNNANKGSILETLFGNTLPSLFSAASSTIVGVKNADAQQQQSSFMDEFSDWFRANQGGQGQNNQPRNNMNTTVILVLVIVGLVGLWFLKKLLP